MFATTTQSISVKCLTLNPLPSLFSFQPTPPPPNPLCPLPSLNLTYHPPPLTHCAEGLMRFSTRFSLAISLLSIYLSIHCIYVSKFLSIFFYLYYYIIRLARMKKYTFFLYIPQSKKSPISKPKN